MKLTCPHCGYDGSREPKHRRADEPFLYLEDIVCYRKVILQEEETEDSLPNFVPGSLLVNGYYQGGEGFDDGTNPRFLCGDCLEEFPIPEDAELEFV